MNHQPFIDRINEHQGQDENRFSELMYADWLEEQGDPRAEAWRVLVGEGRRPQFAEWSKGWHWLGREGEFTKSYYYPNKIAPPTGKLWWLPGFETYFDAMNAATKAWVRTVDAGLMGV